MIERDQFMTRDKHGNSSVPSSGGAIAISLVASVFGVFWIIGAISMGAPFFFPLFGVVFVGVVIVGGISSAGKANLYTEAHAKYQHRRRALLRELEGRDDEMS
jgi:cobalamin biosynthesis protein CobD/CbiB